MDNRTLASEYNLLRANAARIVAEYFGVSGYKVATVNFDDNDNVIIDYYDVGAPKSLIVPEAWLTLNDNELKIAVKEHGFKKHEEYMIEQQALMEKIRLNNEAKEKAQYELLRAKYEDQYTRNSSFGADLGEYDIYGGD